VDMAGTFAVDAEAETLATILKDQFGAHLSNGQWDFRNAKTLVLFCNGLCSGTHISAGLESVEVQHKT
ncbi:hypothetical protein QQ73_17015, partial [Candidatus Endoriftia persephone str. Guaymas]|nr:hypothetical protein [Candidatus Endoriftia persephone str. Guaymas]